MKLNIFVIMTAMLASGSVAMPVQAASNANTHSLQRRVLCGIFGCVSADGAGSPPRAPEVRTRPEPRQLISQTMFGLGRNPIGNTRVLSDGELQNIYEPIRFYNRIPVLRQGSTSLRLLQSALNNYGALYYTYRDTTRNPHLVRYRNEDVLFEAVEDADKARLEELARGYSFAPSYLRRLEAIL